MLSIETPVCILVRVSDVFCGETILTVFASRIRTYTNVSAGFSLPLFPFFLVNRDSTLVMIADKSIVRGGIECKLL